VVYGPPGSGRRTLIAEAIEAARREGLPYLKAAKPHTALEQVKASDKPPVVVFRSSQDGLADFARTVLQQSIPVLVMVHSERPIPEFSTRGAIQFTPPPLDQREATTLVRSLGADHGEAARWWRESLGLPIALIGRIRRWQREHGLQVPPRAETLPSESHKVLQALPTAGDLALEDLADRVGMSEHVLLDHCEVLFAEGWIEPSHEGRAVRRTAPQGTG